MKLHIHNGTPMEGWSQLDVSDKFKFDKLPFKDKQFEYIYCTGLLQFLSKDELLPFLFELRRVLVQGGLIRFSTPDLFKLNRVYPNKANSLVINGILFQESQINGKITHSKVCFDFFSLQKTLVMCGFYSIKRYEAKNTSHSDFEDCSFDTIGFEDICLNVECYG